MLRPAVLHFNSKSPHSLLLEYFGSVLRCSVYLQKQAFQTSGARKETNIVLPSHIARNETKNSPCDMSITHYYRAAKITQGRTYALASHNSLS